MTNNIRYSHGIAATVELTNGTQVEWIMAEGTSEYDVMENAKARAVRAIGRDFAEGSTAKIFEVTARW